MYTPFAYAIKKTPYAFFAKITLCMYILCATSYAAATYYVISCIEQNVFGTIYVTFLRRAKSTSEPKNEIK